jgi:tetratricopeptide (TPR) repeat protein
MDGGDAPDPAATTADAAETVDDLLYWARVYLMLSGAEEPALAVLDQAARLEPDNVAVLMLRMRVKAKLRRYEQSMNDADVLVALRPNAASSYVERAAVRLVQGKTDVQRAKGRPIDRETDTRRDATARRLRADALDAVWVDLDRAIELSPGDSTVRRACTLMLVVAHDYMGG